MPRQVSGTVFMDAVDHESFGANETGKSTQTFSLVLTEGMPANRIDVKPLKVGGEVRVELEITAQAEADGVAKILGKAKLFEGASDDTDDLEEEQNVSFVIPKGGRPHEHHIELRSRGFGGGDSASITIVATNSIFEQE
ncbi:MAG: hypothetical protein KME55_22645 [Nostoc indistinguendum CM1-VF10]|jgi:hypothetical protein|nr:hypothetical protein [Nostoc indistinguendum CM1-VF10]